MKMQEMENRLEQLEDEMFWASLNNENEKVEKLNREHDKLLEEYRMKRNERGL